MSSATVVAGGVLRERPQRTTPSMMTMLMPGRSPKRTLSRSVFPAVCCARSMITKSAARPGSSTWVLGGVASYADTAKEQLLGVPTATLAEHGAVSPEVALALAAGAIIVLLLALKEDLHDFVDRLAEEDVKALARFAVIALAVLPFLPDGARCEVLEGIGHFVHIEQPQLVAELALDFLRTHVGSPG